MTSPYKRSRDLTVEPNTRALCEGCGCRSSYMVNSMLWMMKARDLCPECEADKAVQKIFDGLPKSTVSR